MPANMSDNLSDRSKARETGVFESHCLTHLSLLSPPWGVWEKSTRLGVELFNSSVKIVGEVCCSNSSTCGTS